LETLIFLIVMGIVSVIFRKAKGKTGQSRNRTFSRDTFEEIRTLVKKQLNYDGIPTTSTLKSKNIQSEIPLENLEKLENKYQQLKQESEVKRIGMSIAQPKVEKVEHEEGSIISLYPDEKTLINGMVWSEILGEPRSKKPFFPRKG
jgi:hypothetical protein